MPEAEITETPQPTKPKSFNWPKIILAAVLGLGLLFGAACTGYWYRTGSAWVKMREDLFPLKTQILETSTSTPKPTPMPTDELDETTDWEIYTDSILGAEFKYPVEWSLQPGQYINPLTKDRWEVSLYDPNYGDPDSDCRGDCPFFGTSFTVEDNVQNADLLIIIQDDFEDITGGSGNFSSIKIENLLTDRGIKFKKVQGFPGGAFYYLYTLKGKKLYRIDPNGGLFGYPESHPKTKANLKIFDQILSTFKFLN